ncbi:unnamed protein product [Closterium sp. NIES-53]
MSEGIGFESQCMHFGQPSAGGCQRSTGDPRLIIGKGYRLVVLGVMGALTRYLTSPFIPMRAALQAYAPPLAARRAALSSPRAAPAARAPPAQPRAPPLQPRAPPLEPARNPCSPVRRHCSPAHCPCSPRAAPAAPCATPAAAVPHLVSMPIAPEGDPDAPDIPTPCSYTEAITGTYVDAVPPHRAKKVDGMWIFRVKRPPRSPPAFKARYVARGFSQRQGVDFFHTFSPTPKMTTLQVLLHVAAQRDYELHSLDSSTAFLQGSLHEEIWLRRPPGFTGTSGMGLVPGGRGPFVLTGHADASWVDDLAMQWSPQGYTFSLGSGSVSWRSTRSSSVLSSSCEAEIYAGAMAAQKLCWLTYLLTDLGERPHSSPALYVDNKAMIALCQEHRLEHRTKHIALRYFLARELQHRGQLCLAYVATRANIADYVIISVSVLF